MSNPDGPGVDTLWDSPGGSPGPLSIPQSCQVLQIMVITKITLFFYLESFPVRFYTVDRIAF